MLNKLKKIIILVFLFSNVQIFAFPSDSIYNLNTQFINQNNKSILLQDFNGSVQVFSMIYTNCKTICPIIVANMKNIENLLPKKLINKVRFSLVSLDPERDSPEVLLKFLNEKKLNKEIWNFYKASKNDTLKLALITGIKYKKEKNNEYTHSNLIIVLDKNGVIKMHHQALDKNYDNIIDLIVNLIEN